MDFFNYLLSLVCFARQSAYKCKDALALKLSKNVDLPSLLPAEEMQQLINTANKIADQDRLLAVLEQLQMAAMKGEGVWEIFRNNQSLLNDLYTAARSDDWLGSKYARKLRECDMTEGRAVLMRAVYSIRMANNK